MARFGEGYSLDESVREVVEFERWRRRRRLFAVLFAVVVGVAVVVWASWVNRPPVPPEPGDTYADVTARPDTFTCAFSGVEYHLHAVKAGGWTWYSSPTGNSDSSTGVVSSGSAKLPYEEAVVGDLTILGGERATFSSPFGSSSFSMYWGKERSCGI